MTTEQYILLSQYADDWDTALRDYFDVHGYLPTQDEILSDAIQAAVNMMHLVRTLPIPLPMKMMVQRNSHSDLLVAHFIRFY